MNSLLEGGAAGLVATAPMNVVMTILHDQLPRHEQYPLPPREVSDEIADSAGILDDLEEPKRRQLATAAHFAFGTSAGMTYGMLAGRNNPYPLASGTLFGLGLWGASYLGFLPALHILRPATQHPARRNALMIAAHLVWGAALGTIHHRLLASARPSNQEDST